MRALSRDLLPLAMAASLIAVAFIAPGRAADRTPGLTPATAQKIQLGYVNGVAYYTAESDGYHVVATLSVADGAPLRVAATLKPEQAVSFSVPGAPEGGARTVEITRRGDVLMVSEPARLVLN